MAEDDDDDVVDDDDDDGFLTLTKGQPSFTQLFNQ